LWDKEINYFNYFNYGDNYDSGKKKSDRGGGRSVDRKKMVIR
jgi:hypothetical protein